MCRRRLYRIGDVGPGPDPGPAGTSCSAAEEVEAEDRAGRACHPMKENCPPFYNRSCRRGWPKREVGPLWNPAPP